MWHGNRQDVIFAESKDYEIFMDLLVKFATLFSVKLHGYCLMTNHVHMLAEPSKDNLPDFMQRLGYHYAVEFNSKYDLLGHVFSGRYRPVAVTTDEHFMAVSRYIHMNPVSAKMVRER